MRSGEVFIYLILISLIFLSFNVSAAPCTVYDNGPVNGEKDAWTVNFGFVVSDSFAASKSATISSFSFVAWEYPGDKITSVDWIISTGNCALGDCGAILGQGTASGNNLFDNSLNINGYGYSIDNIAISGLNIPISAGNYYLTLQNAVINTGDPVYWDENDGQSSAQSNVQGSMGSEMFTISGDCTAPPEKKLVIFVYGLGGEKGDSFGLFNTMLSQSSKVAGQNVDIKLFQYDSKGDSNEVSAGKLNDKLLGEYSALSYSEVYIVAYSLGTLVVRDAVSQANKNNELKGIYGKTTVFQISPIFGGAEYGKWVTLTPFAGVAGRWTEFEPAGTYQSNLFNPAQTASFTNTVSNHYTFIVVNDFMTLGVWNQLRKDSLKQWHVDLWDGNWKTLFFNAADKNYFEFYLDIGDVVSGRNEIQIDTSQIFSGGTDKHVILMNYLTLVNEITNKILYGREIKFDSTTSTKTGTNQADCSDCASQSDCSTLCNGDSECNNVCTTESTNCNTYCPKSADTAWCSGADVNHNGEVDGGDYSLWYNNLNRADCSDSNNWCDEADMNKDGRVDGGDYSIWSNNLNRMGCSASSITGQIISGNASSSNSFEKLIKWIKSIFV